MSIFLDSTLFLMACLAPVGISVGRHSGGQLATALVATTNIIIFFSFFTFPGPLGWYFKYWGLFICEHPHFHCRREISNNGFGFSAVIGGWFFGHHLLWCPEWGVPQNFFRQHAASIYGFVRFVRSFRFVRFVKKNCQATSMQRRRVRFGMLTVLTNIRSTKVFW